MRVTSPKSVIWDEVEIGNKLPDHGRDITASLVAGGAISATHDYSLVHHDREAALNAGADDIFMNILTTNGLIGKYLTDWSGPEGEMKSIHLRLAVPNYPGDRMVTSGHITKKYEKEGQFLVEIEFTGKNQLGNHALGNAIMSLPARR